jgi:hypothetical protein
MARVAESWRGVLRSRDVTVIFLARLAMSTSRAIAGIAVPLYLASLGFSGLELGALYLVVALVAAALSQFIGLSTNRFGSKVWMVAVPATTAKKKKREKNKCIKERTKKEVGKRKKGKKISA